MSAQERFVVVVSRMDLHAMGATCEIVVLGPFRRRERADARAATVERLAAKYDEAPGTLHVVVEPLRPGSVSGQNAMDYLYGALG